MLLEHTVGNLDPLHIVNVVPDGLEIPRSVFSYPCGIAAYRVAPYC